MSSQKYKLFHCHVINVECYFRNKAISQQRDFQPALEDIHNNSISELSLNEHAEKIRRYSLLAFPWLSLTKKERIISFSTADVDSKAMLEITRHRIGDNVLLQHTGSLISIMNT